MTHNLDLHILDLRRDCIEAAREQFAGFKAVRCKPKDITKTRAKAICAAGNSFGDMGGGVDRAIDLYFDRAAQPLVRDAIASEFLGELPVGTAIAVRPDPRKPTLIYAPTMRIPGRLPAGSINPYLAMRAALIQALRQGVSSLACPLFGTGVGGIPPEESAAQMATAYTMILSGAWQDIVHPAQAPYVMRQ